MNFTHISAHPKIFVTHPHPKHLLAIASSSFLISSVIAFISPSKYLFTFLYPHSLSSPLLTPIFCPLHIYSFPSDFLPIHATFQQFSSCITNLPVNFLTRYLITFFSQSLLIQVVITCLFFCFPFIISPFIVLSSLSTSELPRPTHFLSTTENCVLKGLPLLSHVFPSLFPNVLHYSLVSPSYLLQQIPCT